MNTTDQINDLLKFGLRPEDIASRTGATLMSIYRWRAGKVKPHRMSAERVTQLWNYEKKKREK